MRTLITISFLFFAFTVSFGQQIALASKSEIKVKKPQTNKEARVEIGKMHTTTAVTQIANYIAENVVYPSEMRESVIDGVVVLEIKLNESGKIRSTKVVESRSKHFEASVQNAMVKMQEIKIDGPFYYGVLKFQVPIQFSID